MHLQRPEHPFDGLHSHLMSSLIAFDASGNAVQCGVGIESLICHPHSSISGKAGSANND